MIAKLGLWWQFLRRHWVWVAVSVVGIALVVVIVLISVGYRFDWTGFNGYNQVTTSHIISGPSAGTVTRTEVYQPGKALWDWLQLLIVPILLAIGGLWFNRLQKERERKAADQRYENELKIAHDNQRAATLEAYLDNMSELLLNDKLLESKPGDAVQKIARVQTLTVLPRLDKDRKRDVLHFLLESGLIDKGKNIIPLSGADLSEANLSEFDLSRADLSGADLRKADLSKSKLNKSIFQDTKLNGANLSEGDLSKANLSKLNLSKANLSKLNLSGANLSGADLSGADLSEADLSEADLRKADLRKTNLVKAKVTTEQLKLSRTLKSSPI